LNEGVAVLVSEGGPEGRAAELKAAVRNGTVMPLEALTEAFPRVSGPFGLAYAESASAVSFLSEKHGRDALGELARLYRQGASDDEAFRAVTGGTLADFDAAWLAEIGADEPPAYGPQPAPPGPLPAEWQEATGMPGATPSPAGTPAPSAGSPSPASVSTSPSAASSDATSLGPGDAPGGASGSVSGSGVGGLWPALLVIGLLIAGLLVAVVARERRAAPPGGP
jgi:hypothetical protein